MRIYEFSKEIGIPSKEIIEILKAGGFKVSSHMSMLTDEAQSYLQKKFNKKPVAIEGLPDQEKKATALEKEKLIQHKIIEKKSEKVSPKPAQKPAPVRLSKKIELQEEPKVVGVQLKPMMVGEFAEKAQQPASEIILTLLRQGVMATKNQIISADLVEQLAKLYNVPILHPGLEAAKEPELLKGGLKEERMPVIVIIGHVDHGKTTLLDFIRKTRVAEREKGGITQHLGAYEVKTGHGGLVFLDTPGHEAFTMMRARGVKAADVAILVVAADDSVMPQTIEAIKHAKSLNVPIVVAVNKIDKASPAQIEKVKQDLSQHGLLPEEWGGTVVVVPISAKIGTGVDELLDMVVLQAQLLELQTDSSLPARGFILESKIEKGLGPVATVICQYGTLSIGDYFKTDSTYGKVSTLVNSAGIRVKEAKPSVPVLVAGFSSLPQVGDAFEVVAEHEIKKAKRTQSAAQASFQQAQATKDVQVFKVLLKADNVSSSEALIAGIEKITKKLPEDQNISIVHSAVGNITESDVVLAKDTGAIIYGFGVRAEGKAALLASRDGVIIKTFNIIYKLFDEIEEHAKKSKLVKMVSKKTGEAEVLKVFKIKGIGVIAGARVKSGSFVRDGNVIAYRGAEKIGSGPIRSLQKEKHSVKEVQAGFECAFLIEGITDWKPGDIVECYKDVPLE